MAGRQSPSATAHLVETTTVVSSFFTLDYLLVMLYNQSLCLCYSEHSQSLCLCYSEHSQSDNLTLVLYSALTGFDITATL